MLRLHLLEHLELILLQAKRAKVDPILIQFLVERVRQSVTMPFSPFDRSKIRPLPLLLVLLSRRLLRQPHKSRNIFTLLHCYYSLFLSPLRKSHLPFYTSVLTPSRTRHRNKQS